jgi:hypothetical protein
LNIGSAHKCYFLLAGVMHFDIYVYGCIINKREPIAKLMASQIYATNHITDGYNALQIMHPRRGYEKGVIVKSCTGIGFRIHHMGGIDHDDL